MAEYQDIGIGVKFQRDDKNSIVYLAIPYGPAAKKAAAPSRSGKTRVLATTSGFARIPGTDLGVSLNVTIPLQD